MEDLKNLLENELKVYVDVLEDRLKDGTILPRAISWEDGATYMIDPIMDRRKATSLKCGKTAGGGVKDNISDNIQTL